MNDPKGTAFLFDLDGTLIDSVYQHVIAWREALEQVDLSLAVWKIHRRIGMSGGLFVTALRRELGEELDDETVARLPDLHTEAFNRHYDGVRPLPGASELLGSLTEQGIPWAIATSGAERTAGRSRARHPAPRRTRTTGSSGRRRTRPRRSGTSSMPPSPASRTPSPF